MLLDPGMDPVYLFNGGCARCGTGSPLIDTGVQVPYEGIFGFCPACISDLAHDAGMIIANTVGASLLEAAEAKAALMEARLVTAEETMDRLRAALAAPRTTKASAR